ncbi:phage tail tape measure protein [Erwinia sp. E602]|uniref:phage tail tape measure protein n=1 Tax=Erwinia sp. E602 TaxID=2675378 RepID=UPI001BA9248A|nr:phage tail tape measure protein [Erwinia sp. E602]QUG76382.1 phage tail tape measure protein [Erwinia sp. E602]
MDLSIRVAFSAIDRLSRPVNAASNAAGRLSESLKQTQSAVKDVERQAVAFNRLRDSVQKTSRQIDGTSQTLEALNQAQRSGVTLTDKQQRQMTQLAAKLDRLKAKRDAEVNGLRLASEALRRHGVSLAGGSQTTESARRRVEQFNESLERERRQLAAVTQARMRYDRAQQLAGKMRGGGLAAVAGSAAGMYVGARLLAPQMQTQEHAAKIAAQNDEGSAANGRYAGIIQNLNSAGISTDLNRIAESVSAVRSTLGSLGEVGDDELTRISRKAMDMQSVLGGDMTETIQMAAIMMKNGLARSSDEAMDLITSGMQRVSTQMRGELPEILHEYSTHFRSMGFTGAEAMSLLVNMSKQGKFALDKTGDAIKEFSIRGSDMSKNSVNAYTEIGLNAAAMSSAIARGGDSARAAMQKTAQGLLKIKDPAARANAAISLFGTPIEDLSVDQIPAFLSALGNVSNQMGDTRGSADRLGVTLRDNLAGDVGKLGGAMDGLRTAALASVSDMLRRLVQGIASGVNSMREWINEHPQLTQALLVTLAALTALVGVIGIASLAAAFILGPFAKLKLGLSMMGLSSVTASTGISSLSLTLNGLRAILAGLLGVPGLIAAAFIAAGLLIWKYWEPIKAFFGGFFSGIWQALTPLRAALAPFAPIFTALADGVRSVWEWFKNLLSPVQASQETLDKCAVAGRVFGTVLAGAIQLVMTPVRLLLDALGWILEKLGVLPDEAERARRKIEEAQATALLEGKVSLLAGDIAAATRGKPKPPAEFVGPPAPPAGGILTGSNTAVTKNLTKIADNTKATADNTKKVGPGDIVFKNLPQALALRGAYQETRVIPQPVPRISAAAGAVLSVPAAKERAAAVPVSVSTGGTPVFQIIFQDTGKYTQQELEKLARNAVKEALASTRRSNRGSFRDRE